MAKFKFWIKKFMYFFPVLYINCLTTGISNVNLIIHNIVKEMNKLLCKIHLSGWF